MSKVPDGALPAELNIVARRILLDALTALHQHGDSLTIVGAQAVYLRPQTSILPSPPSPATPISGWTPPC